MAQLGWRSPNTLESLWRELPDRRVVCFDETGFKGERETALCLPERLQVRRMLELSVKKAAALKREQFLPLSSARF